MKTTFQIQNLKCGGCAKSITKKLSELKEINDVIVEKDSSSVSFDHQSADDASLVKETLRNLGYPTIDDDNSIVEKAKSFVSCASGKIAR
ncbi:MAG: heavy metal-associated domain-containing protein [Bacteroidota bacterium]|uniref:Heavy-metal-associated domain-containing protein n=1 Tax=Flagellimonas profundi TaxID=2915620 RepID=A0ABS3FGL6_9FLAO|nr:heavy metal-associated domain-containing protein [Allomuricauda profundi]MBO0342313.1 heavy-metal-associated domain-containing protein [Allomuricauda profundi]MEC7772791.1 heavy metal-associated domain-containing protein [Bacteroidota bacterium]